MLKLSVPAPSLRLIAIDIDGTLLNPEFQISETDLAALRSAHGAGIEVILVTGRRHTFALPIAQQLGFDLWLISSNGAVTRSLGGETFHRDLLPKETCLGLVGEMQEFRGQTVLTFDSNGPGTIVIERLDQLEGSIQRWLEKNRQYIQFVVPLEDALTTDPVQAMFCGPVADMQRALQALRTQRPANHGGANRISGPRSFDCGCAQRRLLQGTRARALGQLPAYHARAGHGRW